MSALSATGLLPEGYPIGKDFSFVTGLTSVDENGAEGYYDFRGDEFFFSSHFPGRPVVPGVILTEVMAQVGLVCLGMHLCRDAKSGFEFGFTSADVQFRQPVFPGMRVWVKAEKQLFRLGKLRVATTMTDGKERLVAGGVLSGMITRKAI